MRLVSLDWYPAQTLKNVIGIFGTTRHAPYGSGQRDTHRRPVSVAISFAIA
jgi:hypothetical protein